MALSPDGTKLAYCATIGSGRPHLFMQRLDQPNQPKAIELPGTDGAIGASFSPDSQWISFATGGKLSKISVDGGAVVPLGSLDSPGFVSWGEDGSIVVAEPLRRGLLRIPAGGGSETAWERLEEGPRANLAWPQILPGGKAILATTSDYAIQVLTLPDHRRKTVQNGGSSAQYIPASEHEGYLVYTKKATMFAVPFGLDKLETRGTAVPILNDVAYTAAPVEGSQFAYSRNGTLVYRTGGNTTLATATVQWVDADGTSRPLLAKPALYGPPMFSPDGKRLAISVDDGSGQDIFIYDSQRPDPGVKLTFGVSGNQLQAARWSPDSRFVVFSSGGKGLWWTLANGSGEPKPLFPSDHLLIPTSFTRGQLAYYDTAGIPQIWTVPVEEEGGELKAAGKPAQFLKDQSINIFPVFSIDGRWLAYESEAPGSSFEVYVRPFPSSATGQGKFWQISNTGVTLSKMAWSHDGHELYYQSGDQIMAVNYTVKRRHVRAGHAARVDLETRRNLLGRRTGRQARRGGKAGYPGCRARSYRRVPPKFLGLPQAAGAAQQMTLQLNLAQ